MKRLVMLDLPFTEKQQACILQLCAEYGYEAQICAEVPERDDACSDAEILAGYFPKRILQQATDLRWLHLPSAGVDRYVDDGLYARQDFTLTNSSGAFGDAVAEQLLMGALMLLRNMPVYQSQQRAHIWKRAGQLRFLQDSTVVILGTGNLGTAFARRLKAMGAKVIGISRSGQPKEFFDRVYPMEQRLEAVHCGDVVAACLPLTGETDGILDEDFFAALTEDCVFLNVGRGKTVRQEALIAALRSGKLSGAMLDVVAVEPLCPESPLWDMENVILTPHISGSDLDAPNADRIYRIFYENLRRYVTGQSLENVVDRTQGY